MLETRALRYAYPDGPALAFGDVQVPQGGTLLLHGVSGSGKSTWLALAAGLLTPGGGEIVVAGQPLSQLSHGARDAWRARHVGFLPQRLHLSDTLSVEKNLLLAYYAAGVADDPAAVRRALGQLGVADLAHRRPSQLSGGQAQRAALARMILMEPQVLLADEPTASLDDVAAMTSLKLLTDCASRCNATLVIATHDRRVAAALPTAARHAIGGVEEMAA